MKLKFTVDSKMLRKNIKEKIKEILLKYYQLPVKYKLIN